MKDKTKCPKCGQEHCDGWMPDYKTQMYKFIPCHSTTTKCCEKCFYAQFRPVEDTCRNRNCPCHSKTENECNCGYAQGTAHYHSPHCSIFSHSTHTEIKEPEARYFGVDFHVTPPQVEQKLCKRGFELGQECGTCEYCVARKGVEQVSKYKPDFPIPLDYKDPSMKRTIKNAYVKEVEQVEWEKEFFEKFGANKIWVTPSRDNVETILEIHAFIGNLLESQRSKLIGNATVDEGSISTEGIEDIIGGKLIITPSPLEEYKSELREKVLKMKLLEVAVNPHTLIWKQRMNHQLDEILKLLK